MTEYPTLDLIVPGPCEPKGRPRVRRRGAHVRLYTPQATEAYEERVAAHARRAAAEPDRRCWTPLSRWPGGSGCVK